METAVNALWDAGPLAGDRIAPLVEQSDSDIQLRAWVPGCATGEEAYSLAMLFHEEFAHHDRPPHFIVFASDVDDAALAVAREGASVLCVDRVSERAEETAQMIAAEDETASWLEADVSKAAGAAAIREMRARAASRRIGGPFEAGKPPNIAASPSSRNPAR